MTINLAETTKAGVYAVAQDLAQRLERQKALNDVLRAELTQLAARPCLACATLPTPADVVGLRAALQQADRLLDGAIRQRAMARSTDSTGRLIADDSWPHYLRLVDEWRQNASALAQKGA